MSFFQVLAATLKIPQARLLAIVFVATNAASYLLPKLITDFERLKDVSFMLSIPSILCLFAFVRYFYSVRMQLLEEENGKKK